MPPGEEYFERLGKTTWQVFHNHIYFLFSSLEKKLTGDIQCDALNEVIKTSSRCLNNKDSQRLRTMTSNNSWESSELPTIFISLSFSQLYLLPVLLVLTIGLRWPCAPKEKQKRGRERESLTEWERGKVKQKGRRERKAWSSLQNSNFSSSKA